MLQTAVVPADAASPTLMAKIVEYMNENVARRRVYPDLVLLFADAPSTRLEGEFKQAVELAVKTDVVDRKHPNVVRANARGLNALCQCAGAQKAGVSMSHARVRTVAWPELAACRS